MNLQKLMQEQSVLMVDVREPYEFASGHVQEAENIPLSTIPDHIDRFRNIDKPIVFYCRSGMRSGQAVAFLSGLGVREIYNGGGLDEMSALAKVLT